MALTWTGFLKSLKEGREGARPTIDSVTPNGTKELRVRQGNRLNTTVDGAGLKTVRQLGKGRHTAHDRVHPHHSHEDQRQINDNKGQDAELTQQTGPLM